MFDITAYIEQKLVGDDVTNRSVLYQPQTVTPQGQAVTGKTSLSYTRANRIQGDKKLSSAYFSVSFWDKAEVLSLALLLCNSLV